MLVTVGMDSNLRLHARVRKVDPFHFILARMQTASALYFQRDTDKAMRTTGDQSRNHARREYRGDSLAYYK